MKSRPALIGGPIPRDVEFPLPRWRFAQASVVQSEMKVTTHLNTPTDISTATKWRPLCKRLRHLSIVLGWTSCVR